MEVCDERSKNRDWGQGRKGAVGFSEQQGVPAFFCSALEVPMYQDAISTQQHQRPQLPIGDP